MDGAAPRDPSTLETLIRGAAVVPLGLSARGLRGKGAAPWVLAIFAVTLVSGGLLTVALLGTGGATLVQQVRGGCDAACTGESFRLALPQPVYGGHVVVVGIAVTGAGPAGPAISVSDSLGSAYSLLAAGNDTHFGSSDYASIFGATPAAGGRDNLTITVAGSQSARISEYAFIYEVSGVSLAGARPSHTYGHISGLIGSAPIKSPSTTFRTGSFLLAVIALNTPQLVSAGAGFTLPGHYDVIGAAGGYAEYSTSGVTSPTEFQAFVYSPGLTLWTEVGVALQPQ